MTVGAVATRVCVAAAPRAPRRPYRFARRAGRTVSRAELREAVLGRAFYPGTNVLEVHVSRLRATLDRGFVTPMLLTEKGVGYRLVA